MRRKVWPSTDQHNYVIEAHSGRLCRRQFRSDHDVSHTATSTSDTRRTFMRPGQPANMSVYLPLLFLFGLLTLRLRIRQPPSISQESRMSDVSLYQRNDAHQLVKQAKQSHDRGGAPNLATRSLQRESQLASLPFDVLLCIADSLRVQDINTLELVREPRITPPFLLLINAFSLDMPASEGLCEVVLAESPTCVCYAEEFPTAACERVSSHKRAFAPSARERG